MKKLLWLLCLTISISLLTILLVLNWTTISTITFLSMESQGKNKSPVYNQITFKWGLKLDEWTMIQSHHGPNAPLSKWDRLKIVVDKSKIPYQSTYYQYNAHGKEVEYRVSCYRCHANGPRAIRPQKGLSFKEQLLTGLLNFRVKTYGKVESISRNVLDNGDVRKISLMENNYAQNHNVIKIPVCLKCHNNEQNGIFSRSVILKQHVGSILFLIENNLMPPWPYKLTINEKKELLEILN